MDFVTRKIIRRLVIISTAGILLFASCLTGMVIDKKYPAHPMEDLLYLPSGAFLQGAALCFDEMLSDILWIKTLGYFGSHAVTDQDYKWLAHILDIVTTLDPLYELPYEFGGIILSTEIGDVDSSLALLQKGMDNVPATHERYWYLPFFAAFNYMYYRHDLLAAADFLEKAARSPDSPSYLPLLAARLYANADSPEIAIAFLQEMMKSTRDATLKQKLSIRIGEILQQRDIRILEGAVEQYRQAYGRLPALLSDLVDTGIVSQIPGDPLGGAYFLSSEAPFVRSTKPGRQLELHLNRKSRLDIKVAPRIHESEVKD